MVRRHGGAALSCVERGAGATALSDGGRPRSRSELEAVEPNPQVWLGASVLLDVEAVAAVGGAHGGCSPQGWPQRELVLELLGAPDLPGLHVGLDPGRTENGVGDHGRRALPTGARRALRP